MSNQVQTLLNQISALSFEDQRLLNKMLVANLNAAAKEQARLQAFKIRPGDTVSFDGGRGKGMITIVVDGFSRDMSKVKGIQQNGMRKGTLWTVSANLCEKA